MNTKSRLKALEGWTATAGKEQIILIRGVVGDLDLANSTCTRTRATDGTIVATVHLSGSPEGVPPEVLYRWIDSFPIEAAP
jgi:hypothetical protein